MRFGIVLPTWLYNAERHRLARPCFSSLARTRCPSNSPYLLILHKESWDHDSFGFNLGSHDDGYAVALGPFRVYGLPEPPLVSGTEQTLAYGTEKILEFPEVSHVVWMGDDALFNPHWLIALEALVSRHPDAVAWSVYHSAYQHVHKDLEEQRHDGLSLDWENQLRAAIDDPSLARGEDRVVVAYTDVLVRSICGHGMTFAREEWEAWGVHWTQGKEWHSPQGTTLDMHHACNRPGERWVTKESYVEHTGRSGKHCVPEIPEYATGFVGLGQE